MQEGGVGLRRTSAILKRAPVTRGLANPTIAPRVGRGLLALFAVALASTTVAAVELGCPGGACCILDFTPGANCTDSDLDVVMLGLGATTDGCVSRGDTVSIPLRLVVDNTTAQTRFDVGLWIATDGDPNGNGALTGTCAREILTPPSAVLASPACTDLDLTCGAGPFYDGDGDACGDLLAIAPDCGRIDNLALAGDGPCTSADGLEDHSVLDFSQSVTFPCQDTEPDGFVNVDLCLSYGNQADQVDFGGSNDTCDSAAEIEPGTNAKCKCEEGFNSNIPVADLALSCSCGASTTAGGVSQCTLSYTNSASCTPDPRTLEQVRCGTAAFIRFDLDYDETNLAVTGLTTMDGSASDDGTDVRWSPQSAAGTANIIGQGESGSLAVEVTVDATAAPGTYSSTATAVWSSDAAFSSPVSQTLTATCSIAVVVPVELLSFSVEGDRDPR